MKYLLILAAFMFFGCCKSSNPQLSISNCSLISLPHPLQNGLVAYYPFCGNANDATQNKNHGIITGASLTNDRFGNPNSAFKFNGLDNKITINDNSQLNTSFITISLWYKTNNTTTGQSLIYKSNWSNAANEEYALVDNYGSPGKIVAGIKQNSNCAPGQGWQRTFAENPNSLWHHLVFTYDGSAAKIYIDGSLVSNNSSISGPIDICPGGNLTIGAGWSAVGVANTPEWYNGLIDDVLIYNRAISSIEVLQLYKQ